MNQPISISASGDVKDNSSWLSSPSAKFGMRRMSSRPLLHENASAVDVARWRLIGADTKARKDFYRFGRTLVTPIVCKARALTVIMLGFTVLALD